MYYGNPNMVQYVEELEGRLRGLKGYVLRAMPDDPRFRGKVMSLYFGSRRMVSDMLHFYLDVTGNKN